VTFTLLQGDWVEMLRTLPSQSVQCCITSPPYYGLRSYMPDAVCLRDDLTTEQQEYVKKELERLGIRPIINVV